MPDFSTDDIRAGFAAGVINEAQAAHLITIANQRLGYRQNMGAEDEPFEMFKGFSEIFVTVGLGILYGGFLAVADNVGNPLIVMIISALLTVVLAHFFTLKRRMILPSIALAVVFAGSIGGIAVYSIFDLDALTLNGYHFLATAIIGSIGMLVYYWRFHVPFAIFLFGLFGAGVALSLLNIEGTMGYGLAASALVIIAIVALVIDRRSFLTAGIIYIGIIMAWALDTGSGDEWSIAITLLIMGAMITALGTWWVQLRGAIMKKLPNFPLKHRLPPYEEAA